MSSPLFILLTFVGLVFGLLAGLIAFGITWIEWQKHKFTGRRLWKESLKAGVFAFGFFLLLAVILSYVLPLILQGS